MFQLPMLSEEVRNIILDYLRKKRSNDILSDSYVQLLVALYIQHGDVEKHILSIVRERSVRLSDYFSADEIERLDKEYSAVIAYCFLMSRNDSIQHRYGPLDFPVSVVDLISKMINIREESRVFFPYSGDGISVLGCSMGNISGFEPNPFRWAMSQIFLSSQRIKNALVCGNIAESNIFTSDNQFDCIITFPPLFSGKQAGEVVEFMSRLYTEKLAKNGEMYCLLPIGACFTSVGKNSWFNFRKVLFDGNSLISPTVCVIALPNQVMFPFTAAQFCVVSIKKDGGGNIKFVDTGDNSFVSVTNIIGSDRRYKLKVDSILEILRMQDDRYMRVVPISELSEDFDITPARWLVINNLPNLKEGETAYLLKDIVESVESFANIICDRSGISFVSMRNLFDSYQTCDVKTDQKVGTNTCSKKNVITGPCLLAGFSGGKMKVGRIADASESNPYVLSSEIIAFRLKSSAVNVVTEDFFLREILSEEIKRQAKMFAVGVTVSRLREKDFFSLTIALPSLEKQAILCKEDSRKSLMESDRKLIEVAEDFRKDVHMKKHAIGQTLFSLNQWFKLLLLARRENDGVVNDDYTVGKTRPILVRDIYVNLQNTIDCLLEQISKFDVGYGMEKQDIALTSFIEDYIVSHKSPVFEFVYDSVAHHFDTSLPDIDFDEVTGNITHKEGFMVNNGDPKEYVKFPREALTIIFDNIISNACAHGFIGRETARNIVKIDIRTEGSDYIVTIANNGNRLNDEISDKDVFTYGRTSRSGNHHFGIGGYQIRKLMQEFGGDAKIIIPDDDFTVAYELRFTETNIIYHFSI